MIGSTGALYFMEKDKIKELEQEIETHIKLNKQLLEDIDRAGKEIERLNNIIKHTDSWIDRTIEIIKQQPSEDDIWILERLNGIKQCLKGADK